MVVVFLYTSLHPYMVIIILIIMVVFVVMTIYFLCQCFSLKLGMHSQLCSYVYLSCRTRGSQKKQTTLIMHIGRIAIDVCLEQVKSGGWPRLQFSPRAWKVIKKSNSRTWHNFNQKQLKNQLDGMKKLYNAWLNLTSQADIGFNPHTGCVEMAQDWWTEYLKLYTIFGCFGYL